MKKNIINTISLSFWMTALTLGIVIVHGKWINPHKRIVTADILSLVKEQVVLLAKETKGKGKSLNRKALTKSINNELSNVLQKIAKEHNVIIVPKQAVLAGDTEDVTEVIRSVIVKNGNSLKKNLVLFTDPGK